jgi:hypothetical protein
MTGWLRRGVVDPTCSPKLTMKWQAAWVQKKINELELEEAFHLMLPL